ncbi:MAG: transcriptional repressor LexA [Gammaproteobacteria bacterium TMED112]|nr:MAG: transcriptional repressor LexA [Gammaproteobacteria bacterium TMED112]
MLNLTAQQIKVFDVIKESLQSNGYPPTRAEIAKILDFKSVNAAESHIKALVKKGVIRKVPGSSRGIKLVEEISGIPLIGSVAAGSPIMAFENVEKNIHSNPLNKSVDFFLRVQGESMIDAGILNNDLVGVRKTKNAENGEIVVARLDDEVTLKRFKKDSSGIRLLAENESFSDIKIDETSNFSIEGKAVGIIREAL